MSKKYDEKSLIHYQKSWENALHSDQITAQIGLFSLKMVLSVNGAALIAIMAAYPSLAKDSPTLAKILPEVGLYMVYGLVAALVSAMCAYFYQGQLTSKRWSEHNTNHGAGGDSDCTKKWRNIAIDTLNIFYVVAWFLSAILFIFGCSKLVSAL